MIQVHLLIRAQINHRAYPALHAAGRVSFAAVVFTSVVCAYPVTQTPDQKAPCGYETWPCPCSLPNGRSHSEMIMLQRKLWDTPEFRARMDDLERYDWVFELSCAGLYIAVFVFCLKVWGVQLRL